MNFYLAFPVSPGMRLWFQSTVCTFVLRDQAIETVPTRSRYALSGVGQDIYEAGWRGGEAYLKLKRYEQVVFYRFTKRGYALYKAGRRGERAIKLAGKLRPILCMFGFNCSVPYKIICFQ